MGGAKKRFETGETLTIMPRLRLQAIDAMRAALQRVLPQARRDPDLRHLIEAAARCLVRRRQLLQRVHAVDESAAVAGVEFEAFLRPTGVDEAENIEDGRKGAMPDPRPWDRVVLALS